MRPRSVGAASLALIVVGLTGCGGGDEEPTAEAGKTVTSTATATTTATVTVTAEPTTDEPTSDGPVPIGTEVDAGDVKVTVEDYQHPIPHDASDVDPGLRADGVLLRVCNVSYGPDPDGVLGDPFNTKLVDADFGEYDILDLTPSPAPEPQWESWKVIAPDACYQGWLAFDLPANTMVKTITYSFDGGVTVLEWEP